jgi:regulatory protein
MAPPKKKPFKRISTDYLHNAGLHYLQRFATGEENFRRVMTRKINNSCRAHADQDRATCLRMLDDLIVKFRRSGLLNDRNYTEASVHTLRRRGHSTRAIYAKLSAKGVPAELIAAALARYGNDRVDGDEAAAARHIMRRRLGVFARTTEKTLDRRDKDLANMARAGFSYETAHRVLKMSREEIEALATGDFA